MNNSEKSKTIAKNTLFLYLRMLFLMAVNIYTSRVVLQAIGVEDYGIYNVVGGFVALFSLVSAALTSACTRFINYEMGKGNTERLNTVFSTTVTVQALLALIVVVLTESIGVWYLNNHMVIPPDRIAAANWVFQFSIVTFCLNLITVPFNAAIIAHERMKTFAYVSIIDGTAKLLIAYLVMAPLFDKLVYYALLLCVLQLVIQTIYRVYCKRSFDECTYHFIIDKPLLKQMFGYAGWHLIGNSATILKNQGVDLILNLFFGPVVNAAKGIANQVLSAVMGFASNFMMALNPQITQSYARGDYDYMMTLINKGARYSYYILMLLSIPIIVEADYLLHLWLVEVPEYATIFVQLSLVVSMIAALSNPLMTAQNATGKVRNYQIIVGGILLLNLPLCYVFLRLGCTPDAVLLVAVTIEIFCLIARLVIIPRYVTSFNSLLFIKSVVVNCALVSVLSFLPVYSISLLLPQTFLSFLVIGFVSVCTSLVILYVVGCNKEERIFAQKKAVEIIKKVKKK